VEQALHVAVNDYKDAAHSFYSNDRDATVPGALAIRAISGLTSIHRFHTALHRDARAPSRSLAVRSGGYYPNDFRAAYNMGPVGDGSGQTIGFTLWGTSVSQSDLNTFASNSGTPTIVRGQSGANGIDWIPVNGGSSDTNELVETAMDVEYAHGVAPNSHLKYWLADCAFDVTTGNCNPSDTGLEQAISAAANTTDPNLHAVSNSWGGGEAASTSDPFTSNTNASLQHAAGVGITFYFSSGDQGSSSGGTGLPSYPADSPYVVSVGGTTLNTGTGYAYSSESAWNGSGGGCSTVFSRPSWQTGIGAATCSGRAEPDVAADADPNSGADVYVNGTSQQIGGTSLAAPLWSGMAANLNRYLGANGKPLMGFSAPRIYQLATNATTYARSDQYAATRSHQYARSWGHGDQASDANRDGDQASGADPNQHAGPRRDQHAGSHRDEHAGSHRDEHAAPGPNQHASPDGQHRGQPWLRERPWRRLVRVLQRRLRGHRHVQSAHGLVQRRRVRLQQLHRVRMATIDDTEQRQPALLVVHDQLGGLDDGV